MCNLYYLLIWMVNVFEFLLALENALISERVRGLSLGIGWLRKLWNSVQTESVFLIASNRCLTEICFLRIFFFEINSKEFFSDVENAVICSVGVFMLWWIEKINYLTLLKQSLYLVAWDLILVFKNICFRIRGKWGKN